MVKLALDTTEDSDLVRNIRDLLLDEYQKLVGYTTELYPDVEMVLSFIENHNIPWGIVTNKPTLYTDLLFKRAHFKMTPQCLVCGDTLSERKPSPAPLLLAAKELQVEPQDCLYVGDARTDVEAGLAANMITVAANWSRYYDLNDHPKEWGAHFVYTDIKKIIELLPIQEKTSCDDL